MVNKQRQQAETQKIINAQKYLRSDNRLKDMDTAVIKNLQSKKKTKYDIPENMSSIQKIYNAEKRKEM